MTESSIKRFLRQSQWPPWAQQTAHYLHVYIRDVNRAQLTNQASSMAYTTLLALVPSLAAIFTLLGLFLPILGSHSDLLDQARQFIFKNLATGSGSQVVDYLETFIAGLNLKKIGMSAFVGLLVTLIMLLRQIEGALNTIWLVTDARPMVTRFIYFWLFLTLGMFGISVVIGLSTSYSVTALITKQTLAVADRADDIPIIAMLSNWAAGCFVFFLIYKIVPNTDVSNRPAARGALLAGTLFYVLSKLYTVYVASFANYKSVYGTLAALPIFLLWLYVCWLILLAGALFAWRVQTGFPPLLQDKTVEVITHQKDHMRNHLIHARLPLLVLLTIHAKFADKSGDGLSMGELVSKLRLPHSWIHEAVEILREMKLVLHGRVAVQVGKSSIDAERWFPTHPAENVSVDEFRAQLKTPLDEWATAWLPDIPPRMKELVTSEIMITKGATVATMLREITRES